MLSTKQFLTVAEHRLNEGNMRIVPVVLESKNATPLRLEFAIVNQRLKRTEYIIAYRFDLNTFVNIIGVFSSVSTSFTWYLNQIENELKEFDKFLDERD